MKRRTALENLFHFLFKTHFFEGREIFTEKRYWKGVSLLPFDYLSSLSSSHISYSMSIPLSMFLLFKERCKDADNWSSEHQDSHLWTYSWEGKKLHLKLLSSFSSSSAPSNEHLSLFFSLSQTYIYTYTHINIYIFSALYLRCVYPLKYRVSIVSVEKEWIEGLEKFFSLLQKRKSFCCMFLWNWFKMMITMIKMMKLEERSQPNVSIWEVNWLFRDMDSVSGLRSMSWFYFESRVSSWLKKAIDGLDGHTSGDEILVMERKWKEDWITERDAPESWDQDSHFFPFFSHELKMFILSKLQLQFKVRRGS